MSWIDDIVDVGSSLWNYGKTAVSWLGGSGVGPTLAKTALLGLAANKLIDSATPTNVTPAATATPEVDRGVRLQVNPDAEHKIPVIYGNAYIGGIVTDAQISTDAMNMYYVIVIAEKTGIKFSDNLQSEFTFENIYLNDQRAVFLDDGITVAYTLDRDGNLDYSAADLIRVYCYNGSSANPVVPENYTNSSLLPAFSIVPTWTGSHEMNDLIFAVVQVSYNKDKNITNLPTVTFHVNNSMTLPGDCIFDYMTNTRYGAGIAESEIYVR